MDNMWEHKSCPTCGEAIAIRHGHRCTCSAERLLRSRPAPVFCPLCEESTAKVKARKFYPDHVDWVVCDTCLMEQEKEQDLQEYLNGGNNEKLDDDTDDGSAGQ